MIPHVGLGGAVRATAIIATLFLVAGNAIFVWRPLPKQEKPLYPVPRLDLAKYSQEKEYIYAAGGYVTRPISFFGLLWSVTYAPYFYPYLHSMFLTMFFIYYPGAYHFGVI
jgi:hypothetical protein